MSIELNWNKTALNWDQVKELLPKTFKSDGLPSEYNLNESLDLIEELLKDPIITDEIHEGLIEGFIDSTSEFWYEEIIDNLFDTIGLRYPDIADSEKFEIINKYQQDITDYINSIDNHDYIGDLFKNTRDIPVYIEYNSNWDCHVGIDGMESDYIKDVINLFGDALNPVQIEEEVLNAYGPNNFIIPGFIRPLDLYRYSIQIDREEFKVLIPKGNRCGLFDPWNGGGSLLEMTTQKDIELPINKVLDTVFDYFSIRVDGDGGYSIKEVYGTTEGFFKNKIKLLNL